MRRRIAGLLIGALALLPPASAGAALLDVEVTIGMQLGFELLQMATVTGTATVNASAGGSHLVTLKLEPIDPKNVGTIMFLNPDLNDVIKSVRFLNAEIKGGTFYNLSGAISNPGNLTQNTMPLAGIARVCLFLSDCIAFLDIPFTESGTRGIGLGGIITAATVSSSLSFSLVNAPWQLATASLLQQTTMTPQTPSSGMTITVTHKGYARGPLSSTTSTALTGGVIQLVSPTQLHNTGIRGGNHDTVALFTTLTVNFLPEPGLLLLLSSGIAGLVLIGRSRMRK
jgi:hypothetical protein